MADAPALPGASGARRGGSHKTKFTRCMALFFTSGDGNTYRHRKGLYAVDSSGRTRLVELAGAGGVLSYDSIGGAHLQHRVAAVGDSLIQ